MDQVSPIQIDTKPWLVSTKSNLRDKPYEKLKGEPGHVDRLSQCKERILGGHPGLIHHLYDGEDDKQRGGNPK